MLTSVQATSNQGALLDLPLEDPDNGYLVEWIEGLDPVKAIIVSSSFARLDGTQHQSSRREARNITIRLNLEPDYVTETVGDLRKRLYAFFMPKSEVTLTFSQSDDVDVVISGRVESCQAALFTKEPAVDISILCNNPDFYNESSVQLSEFSTDGLTEFPVEYAGSVETGIVFTLYVDRDVSEFTFYHRLPNGEVRTLEFNTPLIDGDELKISTIPGDKYVQLTRGSTVTSVLYAVSPYSSWIELMPGENNIRVYAVGTGLAYDIEYTDKYGGL